MAPELSLHDGSAQSFPYLSAWTSQLPRSVSFSLSCPPAAAPSSLTPPVEFRLARSCESTPTPRLCRRRQVLLPTRSRWRRSSIWVVRSGSFPRLSSSTESARQTLEWAKESVLQSMPESQKWSIASSLSLKKSRLLSCYRLRNGARSSAASRDTRTAHSPAAHAAAKAAARDLHLPAASPVSTE